MPPLRKLPSRGWNSLPLGQGAFQRAETVGRRRRLGGHPLALEGRVPRRRQRLLDGVRGPSGACRLELALEPFRQIVEPLRTQRNALGGAPQPVESCRRALAAAGSVRQLLLDAAALDEQRLQLPFDPFALQSRRGLPLLRRALPLRQRGEVELGEPRLDGGDLAAELLGALRGRCL